MQVNPFPFKRRVRVEMVPLIDMFFLLLVFFIFGVFSMSLQEGIVVDLPAAATASPLKEDETVTISITEEGGLFLDQGAMTLDTLAAALRSEALRSPKPFVAINADTRVRHGLVIKVLDTVREAGLQRVSFQTAPEPDDE